MKQPSASVPPPYFFILAGILFMLTGRTAAIAAADHAQDNATVTAPAMTYAYEHVFQRARDTHRWQAASSVYDQLRALRRSALQFSTVSNPVSDRYQVTCYGGTIDLVHFFFFASKALTSHRKEAWLYWAWRDESGRGRNRHQEEADAHVIMKATPDDLPSNAFGALFGSELRELSLNPDNSDLETLFRQFLKPLIPVPNAVAKQFSYAEIILGIHEQKSAMDAFFAAAARTRWLTAEPLVHCKQINAVARRALGRQLCEPLADGQAALQAAGFNLETYRDKPLLILRTREASAAP